MKNKNPKILTASNTAEERLNKLTNGGSREAFSKYIDQYYETEEEKEKVWAELETIFTKHRHLIDKKKLQDMGLTQLAAEASQTIGRIMRVNPDDILSSKRGGWDVSDARFILFAVLETYGHHARDIGKLVGDRDRTSVLHGVKQLRKRRVLGVSEKQLNRALIEVEKTFPIKW